MQSRVAELKARPVSAAVGIDDNAWNGWWEQMQEMGLTLSEVSIGSGEAGGAIDSAIRQLDAIRGATQRKRSILEALAQELRSFAAKATPNLTSLRAKIA